MRVRTSPRSAYEVLWTAFTDLTSLHVFTRCPEALRILHHHCSRTGVPTTPSCKLRTRHLDVCYTFSTYVRDTSITLAHFYPLLVDRMKKKNNGDINSVEFSSANTTLLGGPNSIITLRKHHHQRRASNFAAGGSHEGGRDVPDVHGEREGGGGGGGESARDPRAHLLRLLRPLWSALQLYLSFFPFFP